MSELLCVRESLLVGICTLRFAHEQLKFWSLNPLTRRCTHTHTQKHILPLVKTFARINRFFFCLLLLYESETGAWDHVYGSQSAAFGTCPILDYSDITLQNRKQAHPQCSGSVPQLSIGNK